jgi:hypothetical protein
VLGVRTTREAVLAVGKTTVQEVPAAIKLINLKEAGLVHQAKDILSKQSCLDRPIRCVSCG